MSLLLTVISFVVFEIIWNSEQVVYGYHTKLGDDYRLIYGGQVQAHDMFKYDTCKWTSSSRDGDGEMHGGWERNDIKEVEGQVKSDIFGSKDLLNLSQFLCFKLPW